jgi:hypothetical protein
MLFPVPAEIDSAISGPEEAKVQRQKYLTPGSDPGTGADFGKSVAKVSNEFAVRAHR